MAKKKTTKKVSKSKSSKTKKTIKTKKAVKKAVNKAVVKQKEIKQIVNKKMLIGEIAAKYPRAVEIMFKYGMHCIGCGMTAYESLEQGCMAHGMSEEEIDKMIEEINKTVG